MEKSLGHWDLWLLLFGASPLNQAPQAGGVSSYWGCVGMAGTWEASGKHSLCMAIFKVPFRSPREGLLPFWLNGVEKRPRAGTTCPASQS